MRVTMIKKDLATPHQPQSPHRYHSSSSPGQRQADAKLPSPLPHMETPLGHRHDPQVRRDDLRNRLLLQGG